MNKRKLTIAGAGIVLIAGAAMVGPIVYAKMQDDAPPPLSVTESTAAPDTSTGALATDGAWKVVADSQAGYRVDEVLNGQDVTVVGRTEDVTGDVTIKNDEVTGAQVVIDTASITTDSSNRDSYFRNEALKVEQNPNAEFTLDEPIPLPDIGSKPVEVTAKGQLQLAGEAKSVTFDIKIVRTDEGVAAAGAIPITFKDYGVTAPNLGFVKVEDKGTVEFLLNLEK